MSIQHEKTEFKHRLFLAAFIPFLIVCLMVLSKTVELCMDVDFYKFGIQPREVKSLWNVFTIVFVHADWEHLANNAISFFVLSVFLFYFYRYLALRVLVLTWVFSGLLLWLIGRDSYHVGASGWIYGIAFFLFFSGFFRKMSSVTAISFIVAMLYGSMVWHVFPWKVDDPVSWEGHLAGGITGLFLSVVYRKCDPQPIEKVWEDEDNEFEEDANENEEEK